MLGFRLMENFDCPYFAASIQDFWRRWHISLSSWFKDYLYFPLGGSPEGQGRTCLNVMIVFFVSGLWHGAALTFVAWGLLNGLYQVVSKLIDPLRQKAMTLLHLSGDNLFVKGFRICFTFFLTCMAWVLFRANSLPDALTAYQAICSIPVWGFGAARLEFSGHTLACPWPPWWWPSAPCSWALWTGSSTAKTSSSGWTAPWPSATRAISCWQRPSCSSAPTARATTPGLRLLPILRGGCAPSDSRPGGGCTPGGSRLGARSACVCW